MLTGQEGLHLQGDGDVSQREDRLSGRPGPIVCRLLA